MHAEPPGPNLSIPLQSRRHLSPFVSTRCGESEFGSRRNVPDFRTFHVILIHQRAYPRDRNIVTQRFNRAAPGRQPFHCRSHSGIARLCPHILPRAGRCRRPRPGDFGQRSCQSRQIRAGNAYEILAFHHHAQHPLHACQGCRARGARSARLRLGPSRFGSLARPVSYTHLTLPTKRIV